MPKMTVENAIGSKGKMADRLWAEHVKSNVHVKKFGDLKQETSYGCVLSLDFHLTTS